MKVTQVAICPTEASLAQGRPALTPELLAASGARYSRNNEGLDAILEKIDPNNLDKSVDSIFKMIDYGHQSIADMVPVAMFIDDISIWLAYYVWTLCPTAGGQESSTRYIKLSAEGLIPPDQLGIPEERQAEWQQLMQSCFSTYQDALGIWETLAAENPDVARIPRALLDDPSKKAVLQVARMKRNYGFDRARYFLPVAAATNMMMVMSARGWVQLCQYLLSHNLPEARELGRSIRQELELCAPRLLRHATEKPSYTAGIQQEFGHLVKVASRGISTYLKPGTFSYEYPATASLNTMLPGDLEPKDLANALSFHDNRYAWVGEQLRRTVVRFKWDAVSLAEIRDLNRHRTGTKTCPLVPLGFYSAIDQIPNGVEGTDALHTQLFELSDTGRLCSERAASILQESAPEYVYFTVLGTQYGFEHVTTADKFIYEAELRTGTGAHFRYAQHLHDVLSLWYADFPETKGLVLEGSAEPE